MSALPIVYKHFRLADFTVGQISEREFVITSQELSAFIKASGDRHPLHIDPVFARERGFPEVLLHGMCIASRCSMFVTQEFVGSHGMLVSMGADFRRPAFSGASLRWIGEIVKVITDAKTVEVKWSVVDVRGIVIQRGTACAWIGNS